MSIVHIECVHGFHNGHDRLQRVAVDDSNELQALFKRVTIFVDNSVEKMEGHRTVYSEYRDRQEAPLIESQILLHLFDNGAFA